MRSCIVRCPFGGPRAEASGSEGGGAEEQRVSSFVSWPLVAEERFRVCVAMNGFRRVLDSFWLGLGLGVNREAQRFRLNLIGERPRRWRTEPWSNAYGWWVA